MKLKVKTGLQNHGQEKLNLNTVGCVKSREKKKQQKLDPANLNRHVLLSEKEYRDSEKKNSEVFNVFEGNYIKHSYFNSGQ